jgi:hypothetical protein
VYQLALKASASLRHGIITKKLISKMLFMADHLESKNLVPFSRRNSGFQLPGSHKDRDEQMLQQVDPDLTAEDEGVIRRYLQYADTLLGGIDRDDLTLVPGGGPAKTLASLPEKPEAEPLHEPVNDVAFTAEAEGRDDDEAA